MLIDSCTYLKSSLDRFIAPKNAITADKIFHLKSSLDRFIAKVYTVNHKDKKI